MWEHVDACIHWVIQEIATRTALRVVFLLTDEPAEDQGRSTYVFFEPLANVVIAFGLVDNTVEISADIPLWNRHRIALIDLTDRAEHLLRQGRLAQALLNVGESIQQILA